MNIEDFRTYCLKKPGVTEDFPFDQQTLVFKVANKMFALTNLNWEEFKVNLKCDPEKALALREEYSSIIPGYHMSKKHWNTVHFQTGELSQKFLAKLIDDSYNLVVAGMTKKMREALQNGTW